MNKATLLYDLLNDPQPGLHTWYAAVHEKIDKIAELHED